MKHKCRIDSICNCTKTHRLHLAIAYKSKG
uniref:Uncharacterized protein n=1 Tax=Rhizophora mucronata TaxID=61149 RepID=A0A2P2R2D6_RHIMU